MYFNPLYYVLVFAFFATENERERERERERRPIYCKLQHCLGFIYIFFMPYCTVSKLYTFNLPIAIIKIAFRATSIFSGE